LTFQISFLQNQFYDQIFNLTIFFIFSWEAENTVYTNIVVNNNNKLNCRSFLKCNAKLNKNTHSELFSSKILDNIQLNPFEVLNHGRVAMKARKRTTITHGYDIWNKHDENKINNRKYRSMQLQYYFIVRQAMSWWYQNHLKKKIKKNSIRETKTSKPVSDFDEIGKAATHTRINNAEAAHSVVFPARSAQINIVYKHK